MSQVRQEECPACFGQGRWSEWDDDQEVGVSCDVCLGVGLASRCEKCGDMAPSTAVELNDGLCGWCAADRVRRQGRRERRTA